MKDIKKAPTASKQLQEQLTDTPRQGGNIFLSIFMAILGLALIYLCDQRAVGSVVLAIGALAFLLPGLVLLLSLIARRKEQPSRSATIMNLLTAICGIGAVAMGIVIFAIPDVFRRLLCYLFGAILLVCGSYQIDLMLRRNRATLYPTWLILAPILLVVGGLVIMTADIFKGEANEKPMLLLTGIGFTIFGVSASSSATTPCATATPSSAKQPGKTPLKPPPTRKPPPAPLPRIPLKNAPSPPPPPSKKPTKGPKSPKKNKKTPLREKISGKTHLISQKILTFASPTAETLLPR